MAKRRMANVMNERERFGEIGVKAQRIRDGARDLRDFKRVRETVAEMVGIARCEDLRLRFEPAKGAGMNYAIAVAGKIGAVGMRRFSVPAPSRAIAHPSRKAPASLPPFPRLRTCRAGARAPDRLAPRWPYRDSPF